MSDEADLRLTKALNDLDAAGKEIERQRARAHEANNRIQVLLALAERAVRQLMHAGALDDAAKLQTEINTAMGGT